MVRWAPIKIPIQRRFQTAAVMVWASHFFVGFLLCLFCLVNPILWLPFILYLTFIINDDSAYNGGRPLKLFRNSVVWKHFCDYFPLILRKEADLDPKKKYLFGYHPHGIIGLGAWGNFGTEGNNFSELFPGINIRVGTLASNFNVPFVREFLLSLGFVSVEKRSVNSVLNSGPGAAIMIVIGGAAEALDARPKTHDLVLANRKGFVKLALEQGASLVPVYSFGENDVFDQLVPNRRGTKVRQFQEKLKKLMGFSMPLFHGRGIFNYDMGILPKRMQMVSVVGTPVDLPKIDNPSQADIDKYHKLYCNALVSLFDKYKDIYAKDRKSDIRFVDAKDEHKADIRFVEIENGTENGTESKKDKKKDKREDKKEEKEKDKKKEEKEEKEEKDEEETKKDKKKNKSKK